MLVAGRFDAFPRGLNEAGRELEERKQSYPQLAVSSPRHCSFPSIYFWVSKGKYGAGAKDRARTQVIDGRRLVPQAV